MLPWRRGLGGISVGIGIRPFHSFGSSWCLGTSNANLRIGLALHETRVVGFFELLSNELSLAKLAQYLVEDSPDDIMMLVNGKSEVNMKVEIDIRMKKDIE